IGLPDGIQDHQYLDILTRNLDRILNDFEPDFILYQSGVDVLETDKLGRLGLSHAGVHQRDKVVLSSAKSIQVPVMCCMGGGYSVKIKDIIDAHAQVFRLAQDLFF
ncbi:MAG: histone deacetylase, partial [Cytophagales bacterium]